MSQKLFSLIRKPSPKVIVYKQIYVYAETFWEARYKASKTENFVADPSEYILYDVFLQRCSAGKQQQPTAKGGTE